jgi:WD40 repeat protein
MLFLQHTMEHGALRERLTEQPGFEENGMKANHIVCVLFLCASACSGAPSRIVAPTSQGGPTPPLSSPAPITGLTPTSSEPVQVPTQNSQSPETVSCTPAMTPGAFFPGGERLLGFRDTYVLVYDFKTHSVEIQFQVPSRVLIAAISPDGQTIAVGLEDFSILLVRASDQLPLRTLTAHTGIISGLSFSPSSDRLLTASEDSWVRLWSLDGQAVDAFQPVGADNFPSQIMGIGISADWTMLATIPFDGWMHLWSMPDHRLLGLYEGVIQGGYSGSQAAFSPDGQYLAQHLGAGGGYLSLWRIADGELLLRGENITTGVDFSSDGRYLAYGEMLPTGGGHISLRTPDGSQLFYELNGPGGSIPAAPRFSPDANLLVAVDYVSGDLLAWTTADGRLVSLGGDRCPAD